MSRTRLLGACVALAVIASPALTLAAKAPEDPLEKRFQNIEKQLKQLRNIVVQSRDTGQPVSVRMTSDPDPVVESLSTRVDDLEGAARTRNDQIDTLVHDIDSARKDAADAHAALKAQSDHISALEARLKALEDKVAAQAAAAAAPPPEGPPPEASAGPPAAVPDDPQAYARAKQMLLEGQYEPAGAALQRFVDAHPDSPNAPEARYWLGETLFIRGMNAEAALAYGGAIKGWPKTNWAPDAVVKLSRTLVALDKKPEACRALGELTRRYPAASPPVKAKAAEVRSAAACP